MKSEEYEMEGYKLRIVEDENIPEDVGAYCRVVEVEVLYNPNSLTAKEDRDHELIHAINFACFAGGLTEEEVQILAKNLGPFLK